MIQAGKMNQLITLYRPVSTKSDGGAPMVNLEKQATPWAELVQSDSALSASDDREKTTNTYVWRLRWRENIEPGHWLLWRGRWMKITGVNDSDPQREKIELDADGQPKSTPPPVMEVMP